MTFVRRARTALSILREQGVGALSRRIVEKLSGREKVDEAKLVFELLRGKGSVMIDVGAHHGNSLAPFADAGWQVYAFEPDAKNRAPLVERFGDQRNVVIDPRGVSDKPARGVTLFRSDVSTGISGLSAFHDSHVAADQIEVTTLDEACAAWGVTAIDFLKIDTEGFDLFVLRGMQLVPRAITCEFEDAKTRPLGYGFHDLARYLVERGYRIMVSEWFPIERYGTTHRWRRFQPYPCELLDVAAWGNLIAVRDRDFDVLAVICERWSAKA